MSLARHLLPIEVTSSDQLVFAESGALRSKRFDDIYFYPGQGRSETEHVFINGNNLSRRWQQLKQNPDQAHSFVIAELGFGTGLNFLVTAQHWLETFGAPATSEQPGNYQPTLYYYSTEKYPLTPAAIRKVYESNDFGLALTASLLEQYPDPVSSNFCLSFRKHNCLVNLVLLFGDSVEGLESLEQYNATQQVKSPGVSVDAWYLDGFAPSKNPSMWSSDIAGKIAAASHHSTTLATFSVARSVRDHLQAAGFELSIEPGFGSKRDMLSGRINPARETRSDNTTGYSHRACFNRYQNSHKTSNTDNTIAIIGAGIAGCCTAYHLASQGFSVMLFDALDRPACGASGNKHAVLFARTAKQRSTLSDLHESCYHYAKHFYHQFGEDILSAGLTGMIKLGDNIPESLANNPELASRSRLNRQAASEVAGCDLAGGGLYYPGSGYLEPAQVANQLLAHENIIFCGSAKVTHISFHTDHWQLQYCNQHGATSVHKSAQLVICAGHLADQFPLTHWLPIRAIRGQTTHVEANTESRKLKITVCDKGYITPSQGDRHECGASYTLHNSSPELSMDDQQRNLEQVNACFEHPPFSMDEASKISGRVGYRATSPDYLPIAGPLSDPMKFNGQFHFLSSNAKQSPTELAELVPGLYINTGYGSHGFTLAPLVSHMLAAQIAGSPLPLGDKLRIAVSPNRFLLRALIKNKPISHCTTLLETE